MGIFIAVRPEWSVLGDFPDMTTHVSEDPWVAATEVGNTEHLLEVVWCSKRYLYICRWITDITDVQETVECVYPHLALTWVSRMVERISS